MPKAGNRPRPKNCFQPEAQTLSRNLHKPAIRKPLTNNPMSKYDLDSIGHIEVEDEENPSTHRIAAQPEPPPRAVSARPMPVLGTPGPQKAIALPDPVLPKPEAA